MAIEIVDLPIRHGGSFPSVFGKRLPGRVVAAESKGDQFPLWSATSGESTLSMIDRNLHIERFLCGNPNHSNIHKLTINQHFHRQTSSETSPFP